jgi:hypothetical protein
MRRVGLYPRCWNLSRFVLWGGLMAVLLVSSPYLLNISTREIDWITRSFLDFDKLRQVPLWLHWQTHCSAFSLFFFAT